VDTAFAGLHPAERRPPVGAQAAVDAAEAHVPSERMELL